MIAKAKRANTPSTVALCAIFVTAGILHFVRESFYLRITPDWVPMPREVVQLTGVAEIAGGLGLLFPSQRRRAGIGLIVLLASVFPANVEMAVDYDRFSNMGISRPLLWLRLPLQPLLIWWVYRASRRATADPL